MSKGPKGPRNPMGWGNDDPKTIKRAVGVLVCAGNGGGVSYADMG